MEILARKRVLDRISALTGNLEEARPTVNIKSSCAFGQILGSQACRHERRVAIVARALLTSSEGAGQTKRRRCGQTADNEGLKGRPDQVQPCEIPLCRPENEEGDACGQHRDSQRFADAARCHVGRERDKALQRFKPSVPSGDDCIRIGSPDEGLSCFVMFADKALA